MERWMVMVAAASMLGACGTSVCSALDPCSAGGSQFCKNDDVCGYNLTDGTRVDCRSCGDCREAVDTVAQWCRGEHLPDLAPGPDMASRTVPPASGWVIPKSGSYTGVHTDPGLNNAADCPDAALEPDDTPATARPFSLRVDDPSTPKLVKLAVCPAGANDIDMFRITVPTAGTTIMAEIFYDVTYGDVDVAILDAAGNILASDGSAATNGCTVTTAPAAGDYLVAIAGANGVDVNRYDARIRLFSTTKTCM